MRFVIQRVNQAAVQVDGQITGQIQKGFLVLVGVGQGDNEEIAQKMLAKLLKLRIFEDENGKTNRALSDVGGSLLMVSQFTLYADCKKGNRPSFTRAGEPGLAQDLYNYLVEEARGAGYQVETGIFGADMKVSLENDGPFTVILDSAEIL